MSQYSPFSDATIIEFDDGTRILESNLEKPVNLNPKVHVIRQGETLASIAYAYYKDSGYWGRIALFNGIINPFTEVVPNKKILIP